MIFILDILYTDTVMIGRKLLTGHNYWCSYRVTKAMVNLREATWVRFHPQVIPARLQG